MKKSIFFVFVYLISSCQSSKNLSPKKRKEASKQDLQFSSENNLNFIEEKGLRKENIPTDSVKNQCLYLEKSLKPALKGLLKFRRVRLPPKNAYYSLLHLEYNRCLTFSKRQLSSYLKKIKKIKGKKIALVLPLSGSLQRQGNLVLEGLKSYLKYSNIIFSEKFVIYDSLSSSIKAKKIYADLFLKNSYSFIMGGFLDEELSFLHKFSSSFRAPVLVFNNYQINSEKNPYFFQLSPGNYYLGKALAKMCLQKKLKKVAILEPKDGHASHLISALVTELSKEGIQVKKVVPYISGDFYSMDGAVSTLFESNNLPEKIDETDVFSDNKIEDLDLAHKNLPKAESHFDGIFIPDNFRILKHFIKLFQFHKVPKITLFGNGQWRSKELTDYWEQFLDDGFFVDYVGSYQNLPSILRSHGEKTFLSDAEEMVKVDLQMIGYYGAKIALASGASDLTKYRHQVAKKLHSITRKKIFEERGDSYQLSKGFHWPSYIFTLKDKNIFLHGQL